MEKIALILIYNIFMTKKSFSGIDIKIFFDPHISCRPGQMLANQHIFNSGLGRFRQNEDRFNFFIFFGNIFTFFSKHVVLYLLQTLLMPA